MAEHLPNIHKALDSNSIAKTNKQTKTINRAGYGGAHL